MQMGASGTSTSRRGTRFRPIALGFALTCAVPAFAEEPPRPSFGREASPEIVRQMDISIGPDGATLPEGSGNAVDGEEVYAEKCLVCHGVEGEEGEADTLAGGLGTLNTAQPVRTVGSYWPYATTLFDYIRRAMPINAPMSLTDDEAYAVTAYVLWTNRVVPRDMILDKESLPMVTMPNQSGFVDSWGPPWKRTWKNSAPVVAAVAALLVAVTAAIAFADPLVKRIRLYRVVRGGLLTATLIGLGGFLGAQLGLVEVRDAFAAAGAAEGNWQVTLSNPALVLVAGFTLVGLLLWGRGPFCGWLCPFGALQDFVHRIARLLGIRRREPSARVHGALRLVKYGVLAAIVTVAALSPAALGAALAAEPFETAIGNAFQQPWPHIAWALVCVSGAVFVERAFCRYLCPFGAALAIGSRIRMLDWLRRRRACGSSCDLCAPVCPTRAIRQDGSIDRTECIHCLACQQAYHDANFCPAIAGGSRRRTRLSQATAASAVIFALTLGGAAGDARADMNAPLSTRITPGVVAKIFPAAEETLSPEGNPPAAEVISGGETIGWLFSTFETVDPRGYSGEPFDIIVGLDRDGRITGSTVLELHEPMVGPSLIPQTKLEDLFKGLRNLDVNRPVRFSGRGVDGVRGATISATLTYNAIVLSARKMARIQGLLGDSGDEGPYHLDLDRFEERNWQDLLAWGGVVGRDYTHAELAAELGGEPGADPGRLAFSFYAALATPADVGRNLFGGQWHNHHVSQVGYGDNLLAVLGAGDVSWKGRAKRPGDPFDRIRLIQGERSFSFTAAEALTATAIRAEGRPLFSETGLFRIPKDWGFDPLAPWSFEVEVRDQTAPGLVRVDYTLPQELVGGDPIALEDAGYRPVQTSFLGLVRTSALDGWKRVWAEQDLAIMGLVGLLILLTTILAMQIRISASRRLHQIVRIGFLALVLVWLGWTANAQLTIVNVLTYGQAIFTGGWTSFLYEPLIVLVAGYTAVSLIVLGRGVFCGWLCPFGALQELLARLARAIRLPAFEIPETLNGRLWGLKYVILAGLIATAATLGMGTAQALAEVEPFKTAITVRFERSLPYVAYAVVLLLAGLFVERFYCRFLCPLGAVAAVLGRLRIFNHLRRRPECGNPCRLCEAACPVAAIPESGKINLDECFQCLDCQVEYLDDRRCPPLVQDRRAEVAA